MENQTNMSIKDKKGAYEFKNSNLRFHGMKMDINGNPCFVLSTPNQRAFSVQQPYSITIHWSTKNGNSKESGIEIIEKNTKGNPFKSEEEFESYVLDLAKDRKHVKVYGNNFACGKGNFGLSTYHWEDSGFTEQEKEDLINGKLECYYVSAIDKSMSGWGGAKGGNSKILVICWSNMQMRMCVQALENEKIFKNITCGYKFPKNITNYSHLQVLNFDDCDAWNRDYFGRKSGKSVFVSSYYKNDLLRKKIIPHKSRWIIKSDSRNWNENSFPTESFEKRLKNQFSIIDDTKDVLRAGGKLAGNIVKDTLYNGGILMF